MNRILQAMLMMGLAVLLLACQGSTVPTGQAVSSVLAVESFLADITQQVAGDRLVVETLIPPGIDPHTFEPTPADVARITRSRVLIVNGADLEEWLRPVLENAGGARLVIEASKGLTPRQPKEGESTGAEDHEIDPHFWLDPILVIHYVENIRDGLSQSDPDGQSTYVRNAQAYITQLHELNAWISTQVDQIQPERRLLITNHESFGYYADRYGFRVVGAIIPSVSAGASPSAQQLARLVDVIRRTGALAVFLETGVNTDLAEQLSRETGIKVVTGLYTHSTTGSVGEAISYIAMLRNNTSTIVDALK